MFSHSSANAPGLGADSSTRLYSIMMPTFIVFPPTFFTVPRGSAVAAPNFYRMPLDPENFLEDFLEERSHRFPRPFIRDLVVLYPLDLASRGVRISKSMFGPTVADDLPVRASPRHLLCQGIDVSCRHGRIVRPV